MKYNAKVGGVDVELNVKDQAEAIGTCKQIEADQAKKAVVQADIDKYQLKEVANVEAKG